MVARHPLGPSEVSSHSVSTTRARATAGHALSSGDGGRAASVHAGSRGAGGGPPCTPAADRVQRSGCHRIARNDQRAQKRTGGQAGKTQQSCGSEHGWRLAFRGQSCPDPRSGTGCEQAGFVGGQGEASVTTARPAGSLSRVRQPPCPLKTQSGYNLGPKIDFFFFF